MSKPKEKWWGYVKAVIRAYPEQKHALADLHRMSVTSMVGGVGGRPAGGERKTEKTATRELPPPKQREHDAVEKAIAETDAEALRLIDLVFWRQTHTLHGAAMQCHVAYITAARWHGDFIRLVAWNLGLTEKR